MRTDWGAIVIGGLLVLGTTSCASSGTPSATPATRSTTSTTTGTSATSTSTSTSTRPTPSVTALATAVPAVVAIATPVTLSVTIQGPGVLSGEGVDFGDGTSSGANAGRVACGSATRTDHTSTYVHAYGAPGTYRFVDQVTVIGPPPACAVVTVTASTTVVVAAPASQATTAGAFLTPSRNIACLLQAEGTLRARCASFSPPALVTLQADGTLTRCTGGTCALGNPSPDTVILSYGSAVAAGPFVCLSATTGVTCTVASGAGFTLSRSGIWTLTPTG